MYSLGYNSFWSFGSAAVQELLTKSDLKLDELLEEDGLILEVKNHNQNLYEFILREDNFKELINCAISIPDVEKLEHNQKKCYKFPFTCADILSSDSQPIVSEFFKSRKELQDSIPKNEIHPDDDDEVNIDSDSTEKDTTATDTQATEGDKDTSPESNEYPFLDYLFSFLDTETINLTSAGYFAKIVNNLLNKKPSELISYLYERKPELLNKMIKHIGSKSIAEFLAKVLTFESSVVANINNEAYNERRSEVLKEIIKKLQPESDLEEINNTAYLICEVFGKYSTMHCSHDILQNLLDKSVIDYFFGILKSGKSTSACAVALILGNIFAYYILITTPKAHDTSGDSPYGESQNAFHQPVELSDDIPLVAAFIENLEAIVKFIGNSSEEGVPGQHGSVAVPFGSARLKVLELIIIAMKAYNQQINNKLVECNFFETLLDIFVKHSWNNMLHNQVEKILSHIIEGNSDELRTALFEKAKLLDFIATTSKDSESTLSGKHARKVRKGYMGQLIRLSNKIIENKNPIIEKEIENSANWKEYVETILAEANQREKVNFGGRDPRAPITPEEDVRLELPSFMQKFSRILNMTGNRGNNNQDKDDDKDEEEKREEDEEVEEEVEEEIEEEDKHQEYQSGLVTSDEFITETEKNVLEVTSPRAHEEEMVQPATVPVRGRHSFDPINRFIPDYDEEIKEENEAMWVLEAADLKTIEEKLDPKYYGNVFWKKEELYSADDILKEFEGV